MIALRVSSLPESAGRGRSRDGGRRWWPVAALLVLAASPLRAQIFRASSGWGVSGSDGVVASAALEPSGETRIDFDFAGHGGWAVLRQPMTLPSLPENYELRLALRGDGPVNDLEVKLVDAAGENVWWWTRRGQPWPAVRTELRLRKRQLSFAWGPRGGGPPADVAALEVAVVAREGGRGTVWLSDVVLVATPVAVAGALTAQASVGALGAVPARAVDGDPATAWTSAPLRSPLDFVVDFGGPRELGGVSLLWGETAFATDYDLDLLDEDAHWTTVRRVRGGNGGWDPIRLPEAAGRALRLRLLAAGGGDRRAPVALREVTVEPLAFGASPNDFVAAIARRAPRGAYPRSFSGEQAYWTVVGVPAGVEKALLSEDGALEPWAGAPALEPLLVVDGVWVSWADAAVEQALRAGFLPMPRVRWTSRGVELVIEAVARGDAARPAVLVRYRLRALDGRAHDVRLVLAVRPFQVDPPSQFLNGAGGVAAIRRLAMREGWLEVDGRRYARAWTPPGAWTAATFDAGGVVELLRAGGATAPEVTDDAGLGSGAWTWALRVAGPPQGVVVALPSVAAASDELERAGAPEARFERAAAEVEAMWRERLGRTAIELPGRGGELAAAMRTALAHILVLADGPALEPGARSYRRAWIRDGALMGEALLRTGHAAEARAFLRWYAGHLFADGKVPCCVDRRGGDPVPENDAPGEYLHLVADVFRHTGDRALLVELWPSVERTMAFLDRLRGERRTAEYARGAKRAFFGLLPASISHEGYSAKPMHSFWDDFWALRGMDDAVALAAAHGAAATAGRWAAARDEFRGDLYAALDGTLARHALDVLPGCVELGDYDPTSSTIALAPGEQLASLPPAPLRRTFARYVEEAEKRWEGGAAWDAYTPYEWRIVGSLVRLGRRDDALRLTRWLLGDRRPAPWNQWPEVVRREVRAVGFLGDLPHAWVGADFLRSALDLFAYERGDDSALVLGAGVDAAWLDGDGVRVRGLRTPWGTLSYRACRRRGVVEVEIDGGLRVPAGGVVVALPARGGARTATIDGRPAAAGGAIVVRALPARVRIAEQGAGSSGGS